MDYSQYPTNRADAKATGAKYYFTGEPCKHGHVALRKTKGTCVECLKIEWQEGNIKRAEYFRAYNDSEAGKAAKQRYYEANKELVVLKALSRPNAQRRLYRKNWKVNNPSEVKASTNDRRRRHKNATPKWLTKEQKAEIRQMYLDALTTSKVTKVHYVVDHIIPIRGESVCGLHVPWNLQIITQEENLKKSNKLLDSPQIT
jgi:5-methylcytosine-specific restriction endonuclease McrA